MAYQHDSDGPHADKGVYIAKILAYVAVSAIIIFGSRLAIKALWDKDDSLDVVKVAIESELLKEDIINYHVKANGNDLEVSLWESGMTSLSKKAALGDVESLNKWDLEKERIQYLASVANDKKYMFDNVDDINVFFKLVNEDNHARSLLVYKNGKTAYDIVAEYQNGG